MPTAVVEARASSGENGELTLEVYSKPSCVQCGATQRKASRLHLSYIDARLHEEDNLNQDAVRDLGNSLGIAAAPLLIVRTSGGAIVDAWGGFNPDKMAEWAPRLSTFGDEPASAG